MQEHGTNRRIRRVAIAAGAVAVVGVVAVGLGSGASANVDPEQALEQAVDSLQELPTGVTITGPEDGEVTLTRTEDSAAVTMTSQQGTIDAAVQDERLYLRVDAPQLQSGAGLGLLGNLPAVSALLEGQWVSLDVSPGSQTLAALQSLADDEVGDPAALQAAAKKLDESLTAIGEQLREPMTAALADARDVVEVGGGPDGSTQYRVTLDRAAASAQLQPALRSAFDQALAAVDTFVAEAGPQLPDAATWPQRRADLVSAFEAALAEPKDAPTTMDVWIADGRFTQIEAGTTTLTFDEDGVDVPDDAVSADDDLVTVLPLLQGLQGLPDGWPKVQG